MSLPIRSMTIAVALLGSAGLAFAAGGDKSSGAASGTTGQSSSPSMQSGTTGQSSGSMQSGTTGQSSGSMSKSGSMKGELNLTSSQKQSIAQGLADEEPAADESFQASEGAKVPESIALKPVPMKLSSEIPSVKQYSFAKLQDDTIILADPKDRTVVAVIEADASTTGSASGSSSGSSGSMPKSQ